MQNVRVTPSEVKEFFGKIPTDSLPYFNSEVEIGEIVAIPTVSVAEKERVRSFLADLKQQIQDSIVTFESMAERYSEDGSARLGGDLGWSTRGKFVPEFEAAAYKLEINEISEPVESQFGFHLIQQTGRRGNSIKVRHILIKPEISNADLKKTERYLDSVRQITIEDSLNFSNAVKQFSDEDQQSYNNDGRMQNPATGNTFFEVGDLNPDIYFAIDTLEVGQISGPFEFRGPTGEIYYRVVQLQSRTAPHTANLQEDYSKIRQAAIDSKRNQFINEWIADKIDRTFIQIESRLDGCPNLEKWKRDRTVIKP
jgi:peptidyl-prolyl cis-trans isomerase SurA